MYHPKNIASMSLAEPFHMRVIRLHFCLYSCKEVAKRLSLLYREATGVSVPVANENILRMQLNDAFEDFETLTGSTHPLANLSEQEGFDLWNMTKREPPSVK